MKVSEPKFNEYANIESVSAKLLDKIEKGKLKTSSYNTQLRLQLTNDAVKELCLNINSMAKGLKKNPHKKLADLVGSNYKEIDREN